MTAAARPLAMLHLLGEDLAAVREHRQSLMDRIAHQVRDAHQQGVPIAQIARAAGVTRNTVYSMIE